jgi:hypothetical protein
MSISDSDWMHKSLSFLNFDYFLNLDYFLNFETIIISFEFPHYKQCRGLGMPPWTHDLALKSI